MLCERLVQARVEKILQTNIESIFYCPIGLPGHNNDATKRHITNTEMVELYTLDMREVYEANSNTGVTPSSV